MNNPVFSALHADDNFMVWGFSIDHSRTVTVTDVNDTARRNLSINNVPCLLHDAFSSQPAEFVHSIYNIVLAMETATQNHEHFFQLGNTPWLFRFYPKMKNDSVVVASAFSLLFLSEGKTELLQKNRYLEQFAFIISHDLKEPLRMISSYLKILLRTSGESLNADENKMVTYAYDGALRLEQMINDLLLLSKFQNNSVNLKHIDLNEIISQVLEMLDLQIKEIKPVMHIAFLPEVFADRAQMIHMFLNLLGNSLKFRTHERLILTISAIKDPQFYTVIIRDNGIGFDEKLRDKIFDVFKRLHTIDEYPGTGIGLAICKQIMQRHRGMINARTVPFGGSEFSIKIPRVVQNK